LPWEVIAFPMIQQNTYMRRAQYINTSFVNRADRMEEITGKEVTYPKAFNGASTP
jgi:hypothetical protein